MKLRRVAVYYRVSTIKQDFESQRNAISQWLLIHPPQKTYVFEDHGISGAHVNRPQFNLMMKFVRERKVDLILTYSLDRISRSSNDTINFFQIIDNFRVEFVCLNNALFTTVDNPFKWTMRALMSDLAQVERINIVGRIVNGIAAARSRGVHFGPPIKLTEKKRAEILKLRKLGMTYRQISAIVGLSIGTVQKALRKEKAELETVEWIL